MSVILVRHTRVAITAGVCYGCSDVPLAATFVEEAEAVLRRLPAVAHVVSSPAGRCRRLAEAVARWRDLPMSVDARLRELDFGRWEGVPWDGIPRAELDAWAADLLHARPHGGETVEELRQRVSAALRAHGADPAGPQALLVTHAGVIKAALHEQRGAGAWSTSVDFGAHLQIC